MPETLSCMPPKSHKSTPSFRFETLGGMKTLRSLLSLALLIAEPFVAHAIATRTGLDPHAALALVRAARTRIDRLLSARGGDGPEVQRLAAPAYFSLMANEPAQRDMYRTHEVAERLNVDEATVRRWVAAGRLEGTKIGGLVFVSRSSYEALLASARASSRQFQTMDHPGTPTMDAGTHRRRR